MFSLSFIAILVCVLSLSLSRIESYYYQIAIIIDRLLIIGKGRRGLIPTRKNRNVQGSCSRSYMTSRWCHRREW